MSEPYPKTMNGMSSGEGSESGTVPSMVKTVRGYKRGTIVWYKIYRPYEIWRVSGTARRRNVNDLSEVHVINAISDRDSGVSAPARRI
jgi:hypothetical protein